MSSFCIVCEYNPLHNGHVYLIDEARRRGAENIVCIMSGNATQRGELALMDKYLRAEAAVKCGADLVLELPFPWCSASADYFASAAVSIARHFADTIIFGSECGDVQCLIKASEICETSDFVIEYAKRTEKGEGSASAFFECLEKRGIPKLSSNDMLGLSYIRNIRRMNLDITPVAVKRCGSAYNDTELSEDSFSSATALRLLIEQGKTEELKRYVPAPMLDIIMRELEAGRLTEVSEIDGALLAFFRLSELESLKGIAETQGGIANRLICAAKKSVSAKEMFENAYTKRYTDAKIRRAALYCITGTKHSLMIDLPEYTTLLGANERGRALLTQNRKNGGIPVITKPADAPCEAKQYAPSERLDALYTLARKKKSVAGAFYQKNPYIVK